MKRLRERKDLVQLALNALDIYLVKDRTPLAGDDEPAAYNLVQGRDPLEYAEQMDIMMNEGQIQEQPMVDNDDDNASEHGTESSEGSLVQQQEQPPRNQVRRIMDHYASNKPGDELSEEQATLPLFFEDLQEPDYADLTRFKDYFVRDLHGVDKDLYNFLRLEVAYLPRTPLTFIMLKEKAKRFMMQFDKHFITRKNATNLILRSVNAAFLPSQDEMGALSVAGNLKNQFILSRHNQYFSKGLSLPCGLGPTGFPRTLFAVAIGACLPSISAIAYSRILSVTSQYVVQPVKEAPGALLQLATENLRPLLQPFRL